MPLDRFLFRASRKETFNPEIVKQSQTRRFKDPALVDKLVALDEKIYTLQNKLDDNAKNKNILQKAITERLKNEKQPPTDEQKESIKQFKENEEALTKELEQAKEEFDRELPKLGNIVHDSVPVSNDEVNNGIVSEWGDKKIDESIESHAQALWRIGGYDPDAGAKVAGHRGYYLTGPAVLLNQALINYSLGFLIKKGYVPVQPPYFMNKKVMAGVAQLEEFNESLYHVGALSRGANETAASASASTAAEDKKGGAKKAAAAAADEEDDKYLIATSEQPLCALHIGSAFAKEELPRMYAGISTCFRKEAGKHGKDTWGIFRVHQFDKVEQFVICAPEDSWRIHEEMRQTSEEFLQSLGLPYRVVNIVSGELNNAAAKKYDIEGWFPNYKEYKELMSLSNCTDYQSRAMEIKFGLNPVEIDGVRVQRYVHMLNATLCALTRTICCILENYQETRVDENGNEQQGVRVPQVLLQYMNGLEFIPFVREGKDIPTEDGKKSKGAEKPKATASTASAASTGVKKGTYTIGKDSYKTSVKKLIGKKFATIEEFSKFLAQ